MNAKYFMECPFCNINSENTRILKEGKSIRVLLSNPSLLPGHLLVVPKRHIEKISELNKEEQEELFKTLVEYQELILSKVSSGCDIRQNYRPFQKQDRLKVSHLHFHLHPRELFDELYEKCQVYEKDLFQDLSPNELNRVLKTFSK